MDLELKIFTLNCWGIPIVSKDKRTRMRAIAELLGTSSYDIVCLQEVWTDSDCNLICETVIGVLPYSHYFYSGVVGSGVCVLSRYPFQEVFFHQWPVNGYVHKLHHGDWFGGKGVGLCRLKINDYDINIYSAHLHAEYNRQCDEYQAHRVLQAFDTAQFIQLTSAAADVVILAGDLNTEPGDLAYRIIINVAGFIDAFIEAGETAENSASTNECIFNSYTPICLSNKSRGKRIDYIMYSGSQRIQVDLKRYEHPLPPRVPNCPFSFSDHEAVSAILSVRRTEKFHSKHDLKAWKTALEEGMEVFDDALARLIGHKRLYWFLSTVLCILLIVSVVVDAPSNFKVIYHIVRVILTGTLCFTVVMASLWNKIEQNAVLAGKFSMNVSLGQLLTKEHF